MSKTDISSKTPPLSHRQAHIYPKGSNPPAPSFSTPKTNAVHKAFKKLATVTLEALENRRLLIAQPFALIAGILLYRAAEFEPSGFALAGLGVLLLAALILWHKSANGLPILLLLAGVLMGSILLPIHGKLFGTEMVYGAFYGEFRARVDAIHSNDTDRARIIISNIVPLDDRRTPPIRRARILVPAAAVPKVGDIINAPMRLYRVPGPVVPGGFDSQFHAYFDGIGAFGSTTGDLNITRPLDQPDFFRWVQDLRDTIGLRIDANLTPPISGIARALIVGDQGQVDEAIRADLAASGLAHVLAISGLHLSLVAGGVFAAIRMVLASSYTLGQRVSVKKIAALGGITAALIYLGLSGASVSAIRATLMLVLIFGAVLAGRRALTMRNVAFAALFVIIIDPASIFRPSFQLSFAAVAALVGAYEGYRAQFQKQRHWFMRIGSAAFGIGLTSLIAGAATALFAAYHFQQVAPLGVLANIVAIPLAALIVLPSALIAVLLMPFGVEALFLGTMGWGITQIIAVATFIASLNLDFISAPILGPIALLIGLAGLGWFAFFPGRVRYIGVGFAAITLPLFGTLPPPDLMVADTTQAVVLRNEQALELVSGRANSFAVRAWQESYLEPITTIAGEKPCDLTGCYFVRENYQIALSKSRDAFAEDCYSANLVIARIKAPEYCRQLTQVIDRQDLQSHGVHWAKWTGQDFWVRPAITDIHRPWRPQYP